jgi:hypothetical protein
VRADIQQKVALTVVNSPWRDKSIVTGTFAIAWGQ